MNKASLIIALRQLSNLLELDGANVFKVKAYARGADALSDEDLDIGEYIEKNRLTEIEGIGPGIAEKIKEYWTCSRIEELEQLRLKYPDGIVDMTAIPGFGAKKAKLVYEQLGVKSVDELVEACRDGRVAKLKGFGEKTAQKICSGVEQMRRHSGRHLYATAHRSAMNLLEKLRSHPAVTRAEIAGSLRRFRETVKDIDIVCATDQPEEVMDYFAALPNVFSVTGKGATKTSVILDSTISADLRCVAESQFPFALQHFTGSKEHNTALRARAKELGFKSNEYGLFPEESEVSLPAASEADVYRHLGLDFIEPELRENMGEIEAAAQHNLPRLVTYDDFRGIAHMHTHYSDGNCAVEEYAQWAMENKIEWMAICDHSKTATYAGGLKVEDVRRQWREIDEVNKRHEQKVRILKGIESDILKDGALDYERDLLEGFDVIVASIHSRYGLNGEEQTARLIAAVKNPFTSIIGHMSGRLLLARDPMPIDQGEVIRQCARHHVIVEINADPNRLDIEWPLIHYAMEQGCMLSIGPDAHAISHLDFVHYGISMARKGWVTPDRLINCWSADKLLDYLKAKRG